MKYTQDFLDFLDKDVFPHVKEIWGDNKVEISFFQEIMCEAKLVKSYPISLELNSNSTLATLVPYSDLPFQEDSRNSFAPMIRMFEFSGIQFLNVITPFFSETPYQFILTKEGELNKLVSLYQEEQSAPDEKIKIIGNRHLILEKEVIDFLTNTTLHEYCKENSIRIKKGICLQGEPGNGKTMSLRYIKRRCEQEKIYFRSFQNAKDFMENQDEMDRHEKAVFVFEDFDSFAVEREKDSGPNQVLGTLLNALDGINTIEYVVSIFTTNHISKIDSAMLRNGRIDKVFMFENPSDEEIVEFFNIYIPNYKDQYSEMLNYLRCKKNYKPGFAHIKGICDDINLAVYYNNFENISLDQIKEIIDDSMERKSKMVKDVKIGF